MHSSLQRRPERTVKCKSHLSRPKGVYWVLKSPARRTYSGVRLIRKHRDSRVPIQISKPETSDLLRCTGHLAVPCSVYKLSSLIRDNNRKSSLKLKDPVWASILLRTRTPAQPLKRTSLNVHSQCSRPLKSTFKKECFFKILSHGST